MLTKDEEAECRREIEQDLDKVKSNLELGLYRENIKQFLEVLIKNLEKKESVVFQKSHIELSKEANRIANDANNKADEANKVSRRNFYISLGSFAISLVSLAIAFFKK